MVGSNRLEKIVIFSGGSGAQALIRYLAFQLGIQTTVIVNSYDDGKSTGVLRDLIPGMLGPSDIRKNLSSLIPDDQGEGSFCRRILEYRFPSHFTDSKIIEDLHLFFQKPELENYYGFKQLFSRISNERRSKLFDAMKAFVDLFEKKAVPQGNLMSDMALGNIIIAGIYLRLNNNFNAAIDEMHRLFPVVGRVLNINDGENRILVGLREDGFLAPRESAIVSDHSEHAYREIFLLKEYLNEDDLRDLQATPDKNDFVRKLKQRHCDTNLNPDVPEYLLSADLILAAPGTQFSSLYPSYLTNGLSDLLANKVRVPKVLITNIGEDFDTSKMTARFLFDNATMHLGLTKSPFTHCIVNIPTDHLGAHTLPGPLMLPGSFDDLSSEETQVLFGDWSDKANPGKHSAFKVAAALAKILWDKKHSRNPLGFHSLSIVIPAYNEERCITTLLNKILAIDFSALKTFIEIIFVDDGSSDRTAEYAQQFLNITVIKKKKNEGKGSAVRTGLVHSRGDFIVIQDADLEYDPNELLTLLKPMLDKEFRAVYGSRTLISSDTKRYLKFIYKKKEEQYWAAYFGNYALSMWTFILYGKYITDTLTAYKMYDGDLLRNIRLNCDGFELDHEITTTILKRGVDILEVPISYQPRTHEEGKKIKISDGFTALWTIFRLRFLGKKFSSRIEEGLQS